MKAVFSNYNFTPNWIKDYDFDYLIYDRSDDLKYLAEFPQDKIKYVHNIGSDIYDKFTWIIENYENLPDMVLLAKSNLFKYISKEEFEELKNHQTFTPLLTQKHKTDGKVNRYNAEGLYEEVNNYWYLGAHPAWHFQEIVKIFGMDKREYNAFAPGSNYILPKENILKHPKSLYEKLSGFLDWEVYPGDAQMIERNLYYLWS